MVSLTRSFPLMQVRRSTKSGDHSLARCWELGVKRRPLTRQAHWVNEDSTYKYFEVVLVDVAHSAVRNDPRTNWLCNPVHKHRELRGLISAGKSNRGLRGGGHLYHKNRPSRRATWGRNNTLSLRRYR